MIIILDIERDNPPPSDFPKLTVIEHCVSQKEVNDQCEKYGSFARIFACTDVDFERMTADIRYVKSPPPTEVVI